MRPGDEIAGRYRLEELRGRGPMSEVWRAHDPTLDRTVALKMLSPAADLERFRREARAVAPLSHENVIRLYDYGEDAAGPFMALEWLPGGTLAERLAQERLAADTTRSIARGIAAGLAHLHAHGIVHRDLKPANVLFDAEGRPKLADFGLARRVTGAGTLTEAGTVLGTATYMPPEQSLGQPAQPASDVYSFGVILFQMLTGTAPFVADDALAVLDMHRRLPAPQVADLAPAAPPDLAALTAAALRKRASERPANGVELLTALGAAPAGATIPADAEPTRVLPAAAPPARSRRGRTTAAALALLLLALSGGLLAWAVTRPPAPSPAHGLSTGSVLGAATGRAGGRTSDAPATTPARLHGSSATTNAPPTTTRAGTTTTATTTTAPTTTSGTTTSPTTTAGTTTSPTTTTSSTTAATTTAPATTTGATTTTGAATTTGSTTTAAATTTTSGTTARPGTASP